jgi:hypothetical protein
VFFARIIDKFVNQEEPAFVRWEYKSKIKELASRIFDLYDSNPEYFQSLIDLYKENRLAIDYESLKFIFDIYDYGY